MPWWKRTWIAALLCALVGAGTYLPIVRAEFVWDDSLVQTLQLPFFKTPGDAFKIPDGLVEWPGNYYRPLVMLSYQAEDALNDAVHGAPASPDARVAPHRAVIPHALTLAFHALATALFTLLAARLFARRDPTSWALWAAGLLFAVHPVHAETVSTIAGRSDSLAALFLFPSLLLALRARDGRNLPMLAASALLFLLALLSKEAAASGILLLPLCLWLTLPPEEPWDRRWNLGPLVGYGLMAALYAGMRVWGGTQLGQETVDGVFGSLARAAAFYLGDLFYPLPVSPYLPDLPSPAATAALWGLGLVLLGAAVWRWRRRSDPFYLFCLLWVAVALLPPLAAAYKRYAETLVAQRYLYLPSAGFCLAFGAAVAWAAPRWRTVTATLVAALLVACAVTSMRSTAIWKDEISLWSALTLNPSTSRHALPWLNLGTIQLQKGDVVNAEANLRRAMTAEVFPERESRALALNGLGVLRYDKSMEFYRSRRVADAYATIEDAERHLAQAAEIGIADWTIFKNLAAARLQKVALAKMMYGRHDLFTLELARRDMTVALRLGPRGLPELVLLQNMYESFAREAGVL